MRWHMVVDVRMADRVVRSELCCPRTFPPKAPRRICHTAPTALGCDPGAGPPAERFATRYAKAEASWTFLEARVVTYRDVYPSTRVSIYPRR